MQRDERFLIEAPSPFLFSSAPDLWQWLQDSEDGRKMGITGRDGLGGGGGGGWNIEGKDEREWTETGPRYAAKSAPRTHV